VHAVEVQGDRVVQQRKSIWDAAAKGPMPMAA
jgi:hypothetical protein